MFSGGRLYLQELSDGEKSLDGEADVMCPEVVGACIPLKAPFKEHLEQFLELFLRCLPNFSLELKTGIPSRNHLNLRNF